MVATGRTYWSKDPDEVPPYSDWKIAFAKQNDDNDYDHDHDHGGNTTDMKMHDCGDDDENKINSSSSSSSNSSNSSNSRTTVVTYHIHRCMVGPRCEYFTRIFDSNTSNGGMAFSESQTQHSRIEFSAVLTHNSFDKILKAFEAFLDFCYFDERFQNDRTSVWNAKISLVALHFLSDYLQIQNEDFASQLAVYTNMVQGYLTVLLKNILHSCVVTPNEYPCILCKELINFRSEGLNVEMIEAMFIQCCYENRDGLSPGAPLSKVFDITLWITLASNLADKVVAGSVESKDWSENIAYYIVKNTKEINDDAFRTLTHGKVLPTFHPTAAIILLREERRRGLDRNNVVDGQQENDDVDDNSSDDDNDDDNVLTNLQKRCVDSFDSANLENADNKELRDKAFLEMSHTVIKNLIIDTITRHQNQFNVPLDLCPRILADCIPASETRECIDCLLKTNQIRVVSNSFEPQFLMVPKDTISRRAIELLKKHKTNKDGSTCELNDEQCVDALSSMTPSPIEASIMIADLFERDLISFEIQDGNGIYIIK